VPFRLSVYVAKRGKRAGSWRSFVLPVTHTHTHTHLFSAVLIFIYYFLCCFNDADDVCSTSSVSLPASLPLPLPLPLLLPLLRANYWHLCRSPAIIFGLLNQPQQLRRQTTTNSHTQQQTSHLQFLNCWLILLLVVMINSFFVGFCFDHLLRRSTRDSGSPYPPTNLCLSRSRSRRLCRCAAVAFWSPPFPLPSIIY